MVSHRQSRSCYVAENATIVGDVSFGENCSVWFNAVIRGDVNFITIGNKVNIQDGAVIHCTYKKHPTIIGNNVLLYNAIVHGCTVHDNVLIGWAQFMDNCVIESNSIVAAERLLKIQLLLLRYDLGRCSSQKSEKTLINLILLEKSNVFLIIT
jgi:carbonic anhydrase/acetyltransferase-like protein (isoleucine patch superfamily)